MNWRKDNENNEIGNFTRIKSAELEPATRAMTGTITLKKTRTRKNPVKIKGFTVRKLLDLKHSQSRD